MFNFDHVTLDGVSLSAIEDELVGRGASVLVSVTSPERLVDTVAQYLGA
jgi:hypothetical protein